MLVLMLAFALGVWVCDITGKALGVADYGGIVWDEIVAFMLVLFFTPPGWYWSLLAFVLFRYLRHRQTAADTLFRQQLAWRAGRDVRRSACCRLCADVPCFAQECADMNRHAVHSTGLCCAAVRERSSVRALTALMPGYWNRNSTAKVIAVLDGDTVLVRARNSGLVKDPAGRDRRAGKGAGLSAMASRNIAGRYGAGKQVQRRHAGRGQVWPHRRAPRSGRAGASTPNRCAAAWRGNIRNYHSNQPLYRVAARSQTSRARLVGAERSDAALAVAQTASAAQTRRDAAGAGARAITRCGNKHHCSEMCSCEEAKYYLTAVRRQIAGRQGDGMPCEKSVRRGRRKVKH